MLLQIKTTPNNFFKTYIQILNPLLKLRKKEAEVFEAFLKIHFANRNKQNVNQLLFSSTTLKTIRENLNLSVASFNMHKYRLRKKQILVGKSINPDIVKNYPVNGKINVSFSIQIMPSNE